MGDHFEVLLEALYVHHRLLYTVEKTILWMTMNEQPPPFSLTVYSPFSSEYPFYSIEQLPPLLEILGYRQVTLAVTTAQETYRPHAWNVPANEKDI
jgi:hypothetical protein